MEPNVIDTLRYADRLKEAGVESRQAEAMSRALNDELAGGVATKEDLDRTAAKLQGGLDALRADLDRAVVELKGKIDKVDAKFDAKFDGLNGEFGGLNGKFDALNGKFETQGRYMFLVLALIAALGLFNTVAPRMPLAAETGITATPPAGGETAQQDSVPGGPHR